MSGQVSGMHYLIEANVPGTGPVVDGLNIPVVLYADDAFLMVANIYEQMQELLKVPELFGFIFDMQVDLTRTKVITLKQATRVGGKHVFHF